MTRLNSKRAEYTLADGRKVVYHTTRGGTTNPGGDGDSCYKTELGCGKCPHGNC